MRNTLLFNTTTIAGWSSLFPFLPNLKMSSREDSHDRKQGSSIRRKPSTPSSSSRKGSSSERSQRPVAAATRSNSDINRGEKIKRLVSCRSITIIILTFLQAAAGKISLNIEEQKAGKRSAESDSRLFSERCEEIRRCLLLIKNMDRSGDGKVTFDHSIESGSFFNCFGRSLMK